MTTKRTLQDVLAEAAAEMEGWPAQMKEMVDLRREGLAYVNAEESREPTPPPPAAAARASK